MTVAPSAPLELAISPCPNDTFAFHALIHGLIPGAPAVRTTYADIDVLNQQAQAGAFDIGKVSYAALPQLLDRYALVPCGGALGRGCGPLVLTRPHPGTDRPAALGPQDLSTATVAIPGPDTTAYLLFRLWAGQVGEIVVMPFDKIMPAVQDGTVDAGLVIHESRFTYPGYGLVSAVDLGEWWEGTTGLPIPLGAVLARRSLDVDAIADAVRRSVLFARHDPQASRSYVQQYAQEMDPQVQAAHIALYVNDFTVDLGDEGYAAITELLERSAGAGLTPALRGPLR